MTSIVSAQSDASDSSQSFSISDQPTSRRMMASARSSAARIAGSDAISDRAMPDPLTALTWKDECDLRRPRRIGNADRKRLSIGSECAQRAAEFIEHSRRGKQPDG